jgi:beta-propeller repeat-containing protein
VKLRLTRRACLALIALCGSTLTMLPTTSVSASAALFTVPAIVFQTVFGGSGATRPLAIAVDHQGNSYVGGVTAAADFPTTPGAFQTSTSAVETGFVVKLDPAGNIVYATYVGGTNVVLGIAVDGSGRAYLTGQTSGNLAIRNAAQPVLGGARDAFVVVLNARGSDVISSTYLGGLGEEAGAHVAIDRWGRVVVVGSTTSVNFPGPHGPLTVSGREDGFVVVLDHGGLQDSRLIGGSGRDEVTGVAVSSRGRIYVTGATDSSDFPTLNAVQPALAGGEDAFVCVLDPSLDFRFSTYLGGANNEGAPSIAVDSQGDAYVAGKTGGAGFPLRRPLQATPGSSGDFFVTKIDMKEPKLAYSTYLGGSDVEDDIQIGVDRLGRAYLAGVTESPNFPEVRPIDGATSSLFQAVISSRGNALVYSTRLPSVAGDENVFASGGALAVGAAGDAYVAGWASRGFAVRVESRGKCDPREREADDIDERGRGPCR